MVTVYWTDAHGNEVKKEYPTAAGFDYEDGHVLTLVNKDDDDVAVFAAGQWQRAEIEEQEGE